MSRRVVVIGSGFGGLAAAVRLRAKGYDVTILEARDQPGGRASVFRRDGFSFDAGPTVVTASYLFDELFALHGRDRRDYFGLVPVDPFYRVEYNDGSRFDYVGDEARILEQIAAISPPDVDGYKQLAAHAERIFNIGYAQLADVPFDRVWNMLRIIPAMVKLENYRTVYGLVAKYIRDERLRQAFSFQPLLVGGNPFTTTSIYLLIHWLERKWGVEFAMGGTAAIVTALVKLLGEIGVELHLNTPVERIETRGGRVTGVVTAGGTVVPCDMVVANADPTMVYQKMLPAAVRPRHNDVALRTVRQSMSLFVGYFGTNRTYPHLKHHTIILGPRYKELLDDIFHEKVLARDFSLYLHAPTRTDPSLAPPGCENFYVLSPVPNLRAGVDWSEVAEPYFNTILDFLDQTHIPGLKSHLVTKFSVDPRYFAHDLRSADGAAFGPEPVLRQSAWFRFHNRSTDVDGLYFVGAGTHPGAGMPGVLCTAKVLDRIIPPAGGKAAA